MFSFVQYPISINSRLASPTVSAEKRKALSRKTSTWPLTYLNVIIFLKNQTDSIHLHLIRYLFRYMIFQKTTRTLFPDIVLCCRIDYVRTHQYPSLSPRQCKNIPLHLRKAIHLPPAPTTSYQSLCNVCSLH